MGTLVSLGGTDQAARLRERLGRGDAVRRRARLRIAVVGGAGQGASTLALGLAAALAARGERALLASDDPALEAVTLPRLSVVPTRGGIGRAPEGRPGGSYDSLVLDLGAAVGGAVKAALGRASLTVLVARPGEVGLERAFATARRLFEGGAGAAPVLAVSGARTRDEVRRTADALDRLSRRFLGRALPLVAALPADPSARGPARAVGPFVCSPQETPAGRAALRLAAEVRAAGRGAPREAGARGEGEEDR